MADLTHEFEKELLEAYARNELHRELVAHSSGQFLHRMIEELSDWYGVYEEVADAGIRIDEREALIKLQTNINDVIHLIGTTIKERRKCNQYRNR